MISIDPNYGQSELMRVTRFDASQLPSSHLDVRGTTALVYEEGPKLADGTRPDPATNGEFGFTRLTDRDDYRLYEFQARCGTFGLSTLDGNDVTFGFAEGFYPEEIIAGRSFHWGSEHSEMKLVNNTDRVQDARATVSFETYVPGTYRLTVVQPGARPVVLPLHLGGTPYTINARLPAGGAVKIQLTTNSPRVPSGADPRRLFVRVFNYSVNSTAGACAGSKAKPIAR